MYIAYICIGVCAGTCVVLCVAPFASGFNLLAQSSCGATPPSRPGSCPALPSPWPGLTSIWLPLLCYSILSPRALPGTGQLLNSFQTSGYSSYKAEH